MISALVAGPGSACSRPPRRTPYVPPTLANWSDAYRGVPGLALDVFESTGVVAPPGVLVGGRSPERLTIHVPGFLVRHPRAGAVLVGAGLAPGQIDRPGRMLGWFLATLAAPAVERDRDLASRLAALGVEAGSVRTVILPDSRFPNTGQLDRFPAARVVVAAAERSWALDTGVAAGVRARDLGDVRRWEPIELGAAAGLGTVPHAHDLLGDGSVWLLDLPGYTPGSLGVLLRLPEGPVILGGGAVPFAATLRMPSVPLVATDPDAWWVSAWRVKRFRELVDGLVVVPGFEAAAANFRERADVRIHAKEPPPAAKASSPRSGGAPAPPPSW